MSDTSPSVIVDHVSKRFVLKGARHSDLREKFSPRFRQSAPAKASSAFWALEDVSFAVGAGEALGIVGHNGSGKSTMLKLLTGIMKPTHGQIKVQGRVGALIEVGAGFHPDLTGRENVFLNGSILGLSRREVAARLDEIVAFAGLEQFIDTPVKRYSSGMYMRLAFAIAAHMDPDILLIDEVLAVGDTQFQRKCLRRMKEFLDQGGTVLFVSHSMGQVADLCPRCVWLDHGKLLHDGATTEAVDRYMAIVDEREGAEFQRLHPAEWAQREAEKKAAEAERLQAEATERCEREEAERAEAERQARRKTDPMRSVLRGVTLRDSHGVPRTHFGAGDALRVEIAYRWARPLPDPIFGIDIIRVGDGLHMFTTSNYDHKLRLDHLPLSGTVAFDVSFLSLNEGTYRVRATLFAAPDRPLWYECPEDEIEEAVVFTVSAGRFANGCLYLPVRWDAPAAVAAGKGVLSVAKHGAGESLLYETVEILPVQPSST